MRKIIAVTLLLSVCFTYAQKVKVKKGKLLFDGVPVMKVEVSGRDYTYTNLNDERKIVVTLESEGQGEDKQDWLIVQDPSSNRAKKVKMEWVTISMNFKKGIGELLTKKYEVITDDGIGNLDIFFEVKKTSGVVRGGAVSTVNSQQNDYETTRKYREKYIIEENAIINHDNVPHLSITNPRKISLIKVITYDVIDKNNKMFAKLFIDEGIPQIITFDNRTQQIKLPVDPSVSLSKKLFDFVLANGYGDVLDNGIDDRMQKEVAKFNDKIKNSHNIIKKRGYIIDKKGNKINGSVSVVFETFVDPRSKIEYDNQNNGANYVTVYYIDNKGKEAYKSFPNAEAYIINEDGTETKFKKFKTQRTTTLNSEDTLNNVLFKNAKYRKVVYEANGITIFSTPTDEGQLGFHKEGNRRSKTLVKNSLRNYNMLSSYLKCKLPEEFKTLNYKDINELKKIINSCKK